MVLIVRLDLDSTTLTPLAEHDQHTTVHAKFLLTFSLWTKRAVSIVSWVEIILRRRSRRK